jgi:dolichol-phosphate mannosyltransferase
MLKVSIVIPVLNEEKSIKILTNKIFKVLKNYVFEIIFVDDNSIDSSEKILNKLKKRISNFEFIIRKNEQRDLFQSCFLGIKKSKYKYILIMDGDLQHNPKYIPIMIKRLFLKKADIVVGARDFKENNNNSLTLLRLTSSKIIRFFIFILFGKKTTDPLSGYFLFKKEIFIKNKNNFYGAGFKILSDIIYNVNNLLIFDVIIKFDRRKFGNSKMNLKIFMQIIYFFIFCFFRKVFNVYLRIK